ncbi:hypothetical protein OAO87_02640, partial [bacterium]|nr:hypothetical protein [bacterium]
WCPGACSQTAPLDVDRSAVPETSVGRWATPAVVARLKVNGDNKAAAVEEKKENKKQRDSARAIAHVEMLKIGESTLAKLRSDPQAKLIGPELQGAITKLGQKPKGKVADLKAQLETLMKKPGVLALPAPPAATPPPPRAAAPAAKRAKPAAPPPAVEAAPLMMVEAEGNTTGGFIPAAVTRPRRA